MTADVMVGCLHQAVKGGLPAECGNGWNPMMRGSTWFNDSSRIWEIYLFFSGGMGARPNKDGLSTTQFPAGIRIIPIEAAEAVSPLLFWRREFRPDSGGAGQYRGGLGQVIEIASSSNGPIAVQAMFDRVHHPARGREGGLSGASGKILSMLRNEMLSSKGQHQFPADDVLRLELPGGGGFGKPHDRRAEHVADDVAEGFVTVEAAREIYGVALGSDGRPDHAATASLRDAPAAKVA